MYHFNDRYNLSLRVGIVDVPTLNSLCVLVSQEFFHRSVGLLYLNGNSSHVIYFPTSKPRVLSCLIIFLSFVQSTMLCQPKNLRVYIIH